MLNFVKHLKNMEEIMIISSNIFILFGLSNIDEVIEKIIYDIGGQKIAFDLRMLITESVSNAYYHGNKHRDELPIYVRYQYDGILLSIEIEDSGDGIDEALLEERITHENFLNDNGRGIYLIRCYSEDVTVKWNKLIVKKLFVK